MKNVIVKVLGTNGVKEQSTDAETVGELKEDLDLGTYSASVNGSPASDDTQVTEGCLITFAPSVKGGAQ